MFIPIITIHVNESKETFLRKLKNGEIKCPFTGKTLYEVEQKLRKLKIEKIEPIPMPKYTMNFLNFYNSS